MSLLAWTHFEKLFGISFDCVWTQNANVDILPAQERKVRDWKTQMQGAER